MCTKELWSSALVQVFCIETVGSIHDVVLVNCVMKLFKVNKVRTIWL